MNEIRKEENNQSEMTITEAKKPTVRKRPMPPRLRKEAEKLYKYLNEQHPRQAKKGS